MNNLQDTIPRTDVQVDFNQIDLDLFNILLKLDKWRRKFKSPQDIARMNQIQVNVNAARSLARRYMHTKDLKDTEASL